VTERDNENGEEIDETGDGNGDGNDSPKKRDFVSDKDLRV
jgi:hypothetical protein